MGLPRKIERQCMIGDSVLYFLDIMLDVIALWQKKIDVRNHFFQMYLKYFKKQTNQRSTSVFEVCAEFERFEAWSICQWLHGHVWGRWVGRRFLETL